MFIDKSEADYRDEEHKYVYIEAYSHAVPSTFPTAADIPGYDATFAIRPGSSIYIVSTGALYLADEDGSWVLQ